MWRLLAREWSVDMTPSDRLQVRDAGQQGRRIERPCQPLKMENVAASVATIMLIPVIVVPKCGGDHYRARIWTVVAGAISGKQPTFGLIYQYLLGLWRCAWAALCWKQVSARRLTFRSLMCRALVERAAENKFLTCLRAYRVRLTCSVSWRGKPVRSICFESKRR